MKYLIVIERAGRNFSAYVPDLPGCIATGTTRAATRKSLQEAIAFHLEGLRADGLPIPKPSAKGAEVLIPTATKRPRPRRSAA
ncbi:MAG: type II toxin-antitoxin system HicB family antitoxin [Phycisphaerales bacterium]